MGDAVKQQALMTTKKKQTTAIEPDGVQKRLDGLPPIVSADTRLLILGSFPGVASLRAQQYYGHPQNQFWKILQAIWPQHPVAAGEGSYSQRCQWLLDRGLGLWDVYASCERAGSLDSAIENARMNNLAGLAQRAPQLRAIAHNGGESARAMRATRELGFPVYRLPSTSPANASWSFQRKLVAWRAVFQEHGVA